MASVGSSLGLQIRILVFLLSIAIFAPSAARAQTGLEVLAAGEIVVGNLLKKAEGSADKVAANLATRLKALIDFARAAYSDALKQTVESLDGERRKFFTDLRETISITSAEIEKGVRLGDKLLNKFGILVSTLPGTRAGFITNTEPSLFVNRGAAAKYSIAVYGNSFTEAAVQCSAEKINQCETRIENDGRISLTLSNLPDVTGVDADDVVSFWIDLKIGIRKTRFAFVPWTEAISYKIPLFVAPREAATVSIYRVRTRDVVPETFVEVSGTHNAHSGKSGPNEGFIPFPKRGEGWRINVEKSSVQQVGSQGHSWAEKRADLSSPEKLVMFWKSSPRGFRRRGHVAFNVTIHHERVAKEPFTNDVAEKELDVEWGKHYDVPFSPVDGALFEVRYTTPWKDGSYTYKKDDLDRPIDVDDVIKEVGKLRIIGRQPDDVRSFQEFVR
jgi:hypothetical protein